MSIMKQKDPTVVVWGAGKNCKLVVGAIKKDKCNFIGIVDSNKRLYQQKFMNKWQINAPEKVIDERIDYIIISIQSCGTVLKCCRELGISEDRIINYWNSDDEYDFIDSNVKKIYELEKEIEKLRARLSNMPYELGMKPAPIIRPAEELLELLISEKKSLSRFGDGELEIMQNRERAWFQKADEKLSKRLREIFYCEDEQIVVALADNFGSLERYTEDAADAIRQYLDQGVREKLMNMIDINRKYYDTYVTRPYLIYRDKSHAEHIFELFKKLWNDRDVLLVEGRYAYNGVRNDLFDNAAGVRRIIAPSSNAFSVYDNILTTVEKYAQKGTIVLISLGPTATVLAYDLSVKGIQAIDIGQLDNEYDWYIRGADERIEIPGKCVAEIADCRTPDEIADETYESEIIAKVL